MDKFFQGPVQLVPVVEYKEIYGTLCYGTHWSLLQRFSDSLNCLILLILFLTQSFILPINFKMPTTVTVGILTFMSRISFMHSLAEHEKSFYNLGACTYADVDRGSAMQRGNIVVVFLWSISILFLLCQGSSWPRILGRRDFSLQKF